MLSYGQASIDKNNLYDLESNQTYFINQESELWECVSFWPRATRILFSLVGMEVLPGQGRPWRPVASPPRGLTQFEVLGNTHTQEHCLWK